MPEKLNFQPAIQHLDLVSPSIKELLQHWTGHVPVEEILVAEIDPAFMNGMAFCDTYGESPNQGANCVIVEARRGENKSYAACVVGVNCVKTDFNGVVRKILDARRISFAPLDFVLPETNMEYGSITPIGLPPSWTILIDAEVAAQPRLIIGSGLQKSKLCLPGKVLTELPNAKVINSLGIKAA